MNPLLAAGYKAPLIEEDVWKIGKRDTSMVRCMRHCGPGAHLCLVLLRRVSPQF
jgi:hypothetical protein